MNLILSAWILLGNAVSAVRFVVSASVRLTKRVIEFAHVMTATKITCNCKDLSKSDNYYSIDYNEYTRIAKQQKKESIGDYTELLKELSASQQIKLINNKIQGRQITKHLNPKYINTTVIYVHPG